MGSTFRLPALALTLTLAASLASAQSSFLSNSQHGSLPACASNCPALTGPQSSCGANDWSCFCSGVWNQIQSAPTQICAQTCTNPADVTLASQWYTANCGSDNGATAHPNSGSGGSGGTSSNDNGNNNNNGGSSGTGTSSGSSSSSAASSSASQDQAPTSWWDGHWRWVVMIIVLFFGLLGLAMLGLWLKKRRQRRRDQISGGFNSGITERAPPMSSHPHMNDSSMMSNPAVDDPHNVAGGRDSPARTRDAFMPYGYGYTRSESRLGSNPEIGRASSPLARGHTPVNAVERGSAMEEGGVPANKKSRRVLVRERSGADSVEDAHR